MGAGVGLGALGMALYNKYGSDVKKAMKKKANKMTKDAKNMINKTLEDM